MINTSLPFCNRTLTVRCIYMLLILMINLSYLAAQKTWTSNGLGSTTIINGKTYYEWDDSANWIRTGGASGNPGGSSGKIGDGDDEVVVVNHDMYWNLSSGMNILSDGVVRIEAISASTKPELLMTGKDFKNEGGCFEIYYGDFTQEIFIGDDPNNYGGGSFDNVGGKISLEGARIEIAQAWASDGGVRKMVDCCLFTGQNYQNNGGTIDTLIGVCLTIGMQASGSFQLGGSGKIFFKGVDIEIQDSGSFELNGGEVDGEINRIYINDCDPACSTSDPLRIDNGCASCQKIITDGSVVGTVDLDYWCADAMDDGGNVFQGETESCTMAAMDLPCGDCSSIIPPVPPSLPVELSSFEISAKNCEMTVLKWVTASEAHNKGFEILRSIDGLDYQEVGFVFPVEPDEKGFRRYAFNDPLISNHLGWFFYRIKQVDYNGNYMMFYPKAIYSDCQRAEVARLSPIPVTDLLHYSLSTFYLDRELTIRIYSMDGQLIFNQTLGRTSSLNNYVDLSHLSSGVYVIRFVTNGINKQLKFVKS